MCSGTSSASETCVCPEQEVLHLIRQIRLANVMWKMRIIVSKASSTQSRLTSMNSLFVSKEKYMKLSRMGYASCLTVRRRVGNYCICLERDIGIGIRSLTCLVQGENDFFYLASLNLYFRRSRWQEAFILNHVCKKRIPVYITLISLYENHLS